LDGLTFHAQDLDPPAMLGDEYVGQWHIDAQSAAELAAVTGGAGRACGAGVRCSPLSICGPHRLAPQRLRAHHRFRSPARPPVEPPSKTAVRQQRRLVPIMELDL